MQPMPMASLAVVCLAALVRSATAGESSVNPVGKVLQLLDDLTLKVQAAGDAEGKAYKEYAEWCDDTIKDTGFAIKTASDEKSKLEARIDELSSDIEVAASEIEKLASAIAEIEDELKSATAIREKEAKDFFEAEKELMETVDTLGRAISVLEEEMSKNPTSLAQVDTRSISATLQALSSVLDAAAFSAADRQRLVALAQTQDTAEDEDLGAPDASTYQGHSSGIIETLEDMKDKAETQLSDLRKSESNAAHNYKMLKQSLEDQASADKKELSDQKAAKAVAAEGKASAESDLSVTTKELAISNEQLEMTKQTCATAAEDRAASIESRKEEMKALAEAKKVLSETVGGAESQTYSFVQVASASAHRGARADVSALVKQLAKRHHSAALAQLAVRINSVLRSGGAGTSRGPFDKVVGLIKDMIAKLERQAESEATEKAWCDEQTAKTSEKKSDLEDDLSKMKSQNDEAASRVAELKSSLKDLASELSAISSEQAEMDQLRREEHEAYTKSKADLELGLSGVRKALVVLRDYYGSSDGDDADMALMQQPAGPDFHKKSTGAGGSIIGLLEVVESDFATSLAKEETQESDAQAAYDKMTQENKVSSASKSQDVKYNTKEVESLQTTLAELASDMDASSSELAAVNEYFAKVKDRCIAKPETYEERQQRRHDEIEGLKEALTVLEEETAFVQRERRRRFRGHRLSAQ